MSTKGQALHEYAIALALIAVIAVGALKLLGGDIGKLLFSSTTPQASAKTNQLFKLVDAQSTSATTNNQPAISNDLPAAVSLKLDPETGKVLITDTSSDEKNSTSVDGGVLMASTAQLLAALANTHLSNGQPLPDDIQALLKQLSETGANLGGYYNSLSNSQEQLIAFNQTIDELNQAGQFSGPPYYDVQVVDQAIGYTNQYIQLSQTYQQLSAKLETLPQSDPAVASLKKQVSDYAGAISTLAHENVGKPLFSDMRIGHANPSDLLPALIDNPLTAQYFQMLNVQTASLSPAQREQFFQQNIIKVGDQLKVGTPIGAEQDLQLSLAAQPTSL